MKGLTAARTLAALVALAVAAPALSATYYVSPRAASTTGSGADSSTNAFLRFGQADSVVQPGDIVRVLGGVYVTGPRPARSGSSGNYITYASWPNVNKANVTITGEQTNFYGDDTNQGLYLLHDYISVRGLTFTGGGCTFGGRGVYQPAARFDSVAWCSFLPSDSTKGGLEFTYGAYYGDPGQACPSGDPGCDETSSDNVFYRNEIKVGSLSSKCVSDDCVGFSGRARRNVIRGNVVSLTPEAANANAQACVYLQGTTFWTVDSNSVWLTHLATITSPSLAFFKLYQNRSMAFTANHWYIQQKKSGTLRYWYLRDSTQFCKFTSDTFDVRGPYSLEFLLNNTGNETAGYQIETKGNRYHRCVFRNPWGDGPKFYNAYVNSDTVSYCSIVSRGAIHLIDSKSIVGDVVIDHNTFADSAANSPGVTITTRPNCSTCFLGSLKLTNNLFYHKDTTGTFASNLHLKLQPAKLYSDNNYFALWKTRAPGADSVRLGMCAVVFDSADASGNVIGTTRWSRPDSLKYRAATGVNTFRDPASTSDFNDLLSYAAGGPSYHTTWNRNRAGPALADSTIYSFDPATGAASGARGIGSNGTDAGSYQSVADTTRPGTITDLAVRYTHLDGAIIIQFLAVGDDGATGTCVSYDIRYSLAAINGENFAGATQFVNTIAPQATGALERVTVTGLTPKTAYYFAIKAVDEAGNKGNISAVPSGTTPSSSGGGGGRGVIGDP